MIKCFKNLFKKKYPPFQNKNNLHQWSSFEQELQLLVDNYRTKELEPSELLYLHAERRALELKKLGRLDNHAGFNYTRSYILDLGIKFVSENLALFDKDADADDVLFAWVQSEPHRKLLEKHSIKYIGIAEAVSGRKKFICLLVAY